ncbi:MAG: ATP phosphoribosyltransferase [Gammaproteobacteria bacterium]
MTVERETRIKIAVQKSGRLTDNSLGLLRRCGLNYSRAADQLICFGENMPIDVLLVRDDDIPSLIAEGVCQLGLVGLNVLMEKAVEGPGLMTARRVGDLEFGRCRLSLAVPRGTPYLGPADVAGRRIATSYPRILGNWLEERGIEAQIVTLSGAVEIAPKLGRADLICDLVSTGSTLSANGLEEVDVILESHVVLVSGDEPPDPESAELVQRLISRIDGVVRVQESKYIMLHAPRSALEEIKALLPGSEAPTVMPLDGIDDKVAIHAVCQENVFWETLEGLKRAGASSVLVLPVEKMLA